MCVNSNDIFVDKNIQLYCKAEIGMASKTCIVNEVGMHRHNNLHLKYSLIAGSMAMYVVQNWSGLSHSMRKAVPQTEKA